MPSLSIFTALCSFVHLSFKKLYQFCCRTVHLSKLYFLVKLSSMQPVYHVIFYLLVTVRYEFFYKKLLQFRLKRLKNFQKIIFLTKKMVETCNFRLNVIRKFDYLIRPALPFFLVILSFSYPF